MSGIFITSTGTEIGKTFVTASLCHQLKVAKLPVQAIKPIISGIENGNMAGTDTAVIAESLQLPANNETWDKISPFRYKAPLAPSMAAKLEGKTLNYDALINFCETALKQNSFTIIEGVGGSFVPLDDHHLVANWIDDLNLSSIIVAGSYLGTLSHITATVEAMQVRNLQISALIISESSGAGHPDFMHTVEQVRHWCDIPVIPLPRIITKAEWRDSPNLLTAIR